MYIYLDKQGIVKEIINDEALRQSASNVNEIYVYYDGLQENDIGSVLATYGLPDGTITDEMEVATRTEESEIPYNAERDLKYFQYYKAYAFYHFAIADLALSQEGVVRLMIRLAQKDGEYIKVAGLICFDVEGELVKEDHGVSLAQYNYLVKAWYETKECLPIDGSKAMQGNIDMGSHNVLLNGKTLKDNNGSLNYNGNDLAKQSDTSSLQSQIDTINATQNVVDIVGTKAELNAYVTNDLHANDKIEVLADESQNNANTIYEWDGNAWSLVGSKAPYYSKAESDARYNELKAKSYDKDTASYVSGHVPDSSLVSKSLDGLSENLETTKIQVATNKNNIETLQGNYTGLQYQVNTNSSDIALTKTQVETNKTNIAKNTQDIATNTQNIENLSTIMPTDINVDNEYNEILEHNGVEISGQKKLNKTFKNTDGVFTYKDKIRFYTNFNENGNTFLYTLNKNNDYGIYGGGFKYFQYIWNNSAIATFSICAKSHNISYPFGITFQIESNLSTNKAEYLIKLVDPNDSYGRIDMHFPSKSGTLALTNDLDAKQDKRFIHTVEIHYASNGSYFCFTGTSDKNTTIDSIQDLTTVFANRDLVGVGVFGSAGLSKIHVGSSVNDTTFKKYMTNGEYTNPSEETFATVFNPTGFTITDNVTAM